MEEVQFIDEPGGMRDGVRTGIASSENSNAEVECVLERTGMAVEDVAEGIDDGGIPAHDVGADDLYVDGCKCRHPGDVEIAHAGELVARDEIAVLDRGDTANDGVLDALGPEA